MNHYRWKMINDADNLVFVVNAKTGDFVLKNDVFDELVQAAIKGGVVDLATLMPHNAGYPNLLTEIVEHLNAQGEGAEYTKYFTQHVCGRTVSAHLSAGYFDKSRFEIYFALSGYRSVLEFIRFQKSIAKIPQSIIVLKNDVLFSIYCVNEEFERTFGNLGREGVASFQDMFENCLAAALPNDRRVEYMLQINDSLAKNEKATITIELSTTFGTKYYVMLTLKYARDLLSETVICGTAQVVDETVEQYLKLQNEHEVYTVASDFSNTVLFRIDIATMQVNLFGNAIKSFNLQDINGATLQQITAHGLVYQEDMGVFQSLIADMQAGIERIDRVRMNATDGRKDWYMIEYKITKDENGTPLQAVGKITNVQKTQELQEKASLDLLTGCMNKGTFEDSCINLLSEAAPSTSHAFFILDLDNFKAVNDNLGHFFGDVVLKEIATKLKHIFRSTDYIARIGGDEFAVLMKDSANLETIQRKAQEMVKQIDITYRGGGNAYRISVSVGIACYPSHAGNYEEIYRRADLALYHAKNTGKNAFKIYDASLEQGTMANTTPFDVAHRAFSHFFDQQVALDTFNLLFEGGNKKEAINMVLRHLGERFAVDRCYIFEATDEHCTAYCNTHEWCREGIPPEMDQLQDVPYALFESCFAQANTEGVFYCNDVSQLENADAREILQAQGIVSMLHTYVKKDGKYRYTLGFDDCSDKRIWKPNEISTLMYASKIIAQYLLYAEATERLVNSAKEQLEVIDNLNFHAYIVDNETFQIRYYNSLTKQTLPDVQLGQYCYQALRGKTEQCADCPMRILQQTGAGKARSVIHNEMLETDYLVTASALSRFEGRAATFVSSTDITDLAQDTGILHQEMGKYIKIQP